jgi:hypothetical protein
MGSEHGGFPTTPAALSELFAELGAELGTEDAAKQVLDRLAALATRRILGADYAGITIGRPEHGFKTIAATQPIVHRVDQIQYDLGSGPCVDAIVKAI